MKKLLIINKPLGLTPLSVIEHIREKNPLYKEEKIGYAGRLDPLAEGVLLLMIGDETKNRDAYLNLPKTYEFEVVFGYTTDTYDLLGVAQEAKPEKSTINVNLIVNRFVNKMIGKQIQTYPPYSSKAVSGKPLFWWARNGKLSEITLPTRPIEIYDFICLKQGEMTVSTLKMRIKKSIKLVTGDFRQEAITKRWEQLLNKRAQKDTLHTAKFRIHCSSGTYIRGLVHTLAGESHKGAVTISLLRTQVGDFSLKNALSVTSLR